MNAAIATEAPTLELRGISKSFGSVQALADVDFEVRAGEVMALVGDNGAGKSTLIKCVAGIYTADSGEIFFDGKPVAIHGPKDSARLGIEVVYQDLALCDNLDVVQNMFLGRETHDVFQRLNEPEMEKRSTETMKSLSVTTLRSVRQLVATLSGGQRQSVAVARAVLWNSRVVILDEPTAALGVAQTQQVLDLIARLAQQGLAVVVISHNLHDVFAVADRITVLRLGRSVGVYERREDHAAGARPRDHRGHPDAGLRHRGHGHRRRRTGGRMIEQADPAVDAPAPLEPSGIASLPGRMLDNLRSGNLGSGPVIFALALIVLVFSQTAENFFSAVNFNNIILQMAGTTLLAYGVIFVLLIGEIDLSIAYVSGVAGVVVAQLQVPGSGHEYPGSRRDPRGDHRGHRDRRVPGLDRRARSGCRRSSSRWPATRSGRA